MRITCPYCGERGLDEFVYAGDANVSRPEPETFDARARFVAYAYERANPAGPHRELWHHAAGCHSWLVVERDTRTHEVFSVEPAREAALRRSTRREAV